MLTKEREKEIREYWIFHPLTSKAINELLAEIDRLRGEVERHVENNTGLTDMLLESEKECESLKAENERLQDNRNTWKKEAGNWYEENLLLKDRARKLREALQWIRNEYGEEIDCSPIEIRARRALVEDSKHDA